MRTYHWLTLIAAIVITVFEAWLFVGSSAFASQDDGPTATLGSHGADSDSVKTTGTDLTDRTPPPPFGATLSAPAIAAIVASERARFK